MQFPYGSERRDYILSDRETVLELNEMVWYPPYGVDSNHYHNCLEIGICMEGSGTLTLGAERKAYSFSAGSIAVVPAGLLHSQQNAGEKMTRWRYVVLDDRQFLTEIPSRCRADVERLLKNTRATGMYLESGGTHETVLNLLNAMFDAHIRHAGEAMSEIEALLLLALVQASREPMLQDMNAAIDPLHMKSIDPALAYVAENYRQEIRVQQMARACAMSESYFRKVFHQLMGLSPLEYVNRHRVYRAMHLLHVTKDSVQHIALVCGFPSVTTFARNFVRYAGQNPSIWRRQHGGMGQEMLRKTGETDEMNRN